MKKLLTIISLKNLFLYIRSKKSISKIFGHIYKRSRKYIEIDITYRCNMSCINCNRSCRQAPTNEQMTIEQIEKFVKESINNKVKWEKIRLVGGEPTIHPDLIEMLDLITDYRNNYSPKCLVQVVTNGYGKKVNSVIDEIEANEKYKDVYIENSQKKSNVNVLLPFNSAPIDSFFYKNLDFKNGCPVINVCGIGLTPYGYYPCTVAGGIDRIVGLDMGRKNLPDNNDDLKDQLDKFCSVCGLFYFHQFETVEEIISPFWEKAYKKYKEEKIKINTY